jgi:hypothetical protein
MIHYFYAIFMIICMYDIFFCTYLHHSHECSYTVGLVQCMSLNITMGALRNCFCFHVFNGCMCAAVGGKVKCLKYGDACVDVYIVHM